jgi:hypothetical protein
MPYYLHIESETLTNEFRTRSLLAAANVLDLRNVTAVQAAEAAFAREHWDHAEFDPQLEPNAAQMSAADAWSEAIAAAQVAGPEIPVGIRLVFPAESLPEYYPRPLDAKLRRITDLP